MKLYHVTPYADEILENGFLTPEVMHHTQSEYKGIGNSGLLGGLEKGISFTASKDIADAFKDEFQFFIDASQKIDAGVLTPDTMCEYVNNMDSKNVENTHIEPCDIWESLRGNSNAIDISPVDKADYYCFTKGMTHQRINGSTKEEIEKGIERHKRIYESEVEPIPQDIVNFVDIKEAEEFYHKVNSKGEIVYSLEDWLDIERAEQLRHICSAIGEDNEKNRLFWFLRKYADYRSQNNGKITPSFIFPSINTFKMMNPEDISILEVDVDLPVTYEDLEDQWNDYTHQVETTHWRWNSPARFFREHNVEGVGAIHPEYKEVVVPPKYVTSIKKIE